MTITPDRCVQAASALDSQALARLTELDPSGQSRLLERVLQTFAASVARLRPQFDAARLGHDQAALRLVAHTLKSSAASIGALPLSERCAEVETAIRLGTDDGFEAALDAMSEALEASLQAIDRRLGERV